MYIRIIFILAILLCSCKNDHLYSIRKIKMRLVKQKTSDAYGCAVIHECDKLSPKIGLAISLDKEYYEKGFLGIATLEQGKTGTFDKITEVNVYMMSESLVSDVTSLFKEDTSLLRISYETYGYIADTSTRNDPCIQIDRFKNISDFINSVNENDDRSNGTQLSYNEAFFWIDMQSLTPSKKAPVVIQVVFKVRSSKKDKIEVYQELFRLS